MFLSKKRFSSAEFVLIFGSNNRSTNVVITKKIAPKAVQRNRIKRIVKTALGKLDGQMVAKVIIKKNIAHLKSYQIQEKIKKLIKK